MRLAARPRRRSELTWLVSGADDDQTSTTAPRSLTDLPAYGWPSSTTVHASSEQADILSERTSTSHGRQKP